MALKYLLPFFLLFLNACSIKNYEHTQTKIVTIKSPLIKFSDIGYLRHSGDAIELELFIAGQVFQKIHINNLICVKEGCMSKRSFNEKYLNATYPENILQNILLSEEIYGGKNRLKTDEGFMQVINNKDVAIKYRVNSRETFFKDRKNNIIIKIRNVE